MKIAFITLGCKQNQYETERLRNLFLSKGHKEVGLSDQPDFVFLNTCAVTSQASRQSRNMLRRVLKSGSRVVVGGCDAKLFPDAYGVYSDTKIANFDNFLFGLSFFSHRARAFVKIETGCSNFCSYCIVPYARGPVRTRNKKEILEEVKRLKENGHREVVLTGTHIGEYGRDTNERLDDLAREIKKYDINIRLTSIMPSDVDEGILSLLRDRIIAPHIHLSIQSGSDKILKRMFRRYKRDDVFNLIEKIYAIDPNTAIGGDFIVGFPGEDERDFQDTREMIEELPFSYLHIFRYSPRPYTLAYMYPEHVPERIAKERSKYLIRLGREKNIKFRQGFLGKTLTAYGEKEKRDGGYIAFTSNYIRVNLDRAIDEGRVRISKVEQDRTYAEAL